MWILTLTPHDNTGSEVVYYLPTGKHTVGRKGCGIALSDKSVSRLHAELEVVHAKENLALPDRQPQVSITDKSRFGTLHNGTKLAAGEPARLAAGDELKFGVNQDAYRLAFVPLVVYWGARNAGVLSREEQALILKSLHKLGGHVAYGPEDATVSVMKEVSVSPAASVQLLHSLVRGLPIVTPAYLQAIVDRPALSTPLPSATDYAPQVKGKDRKEVSAVEARLKATAGGGQSSMADGPARLFDGKSFVIMSSRQSQLGEVVSALGGLVVESLGRETDQFYHQHRRACVILPPEEAEGETTTEDKEARLKVDQFRKAGVRPIPAAEVASAIILGDVSTHCNPPPPAEAPPLAKGRAAMAEKKREAAPEPAPVAIVLDETDENEDEDEPSLVITKIVDAEEVKKEKTEPEGKQAGKRKHLEEIEEEKKEKTGARRAMAAEAAEQPQPKKRRVMEIPAAGAVAPKKRKAAEPDEAEIEGESTTKKAKEEEDQPEGVSTMRETTKTMTTTLTAAGEGDLGHEEAEGEPPQPKREAPPVVERLMVTANKRLLARPLLASAAPNFKRFSKNALGGEAARVQASQAKRPHVIACVEDDGKPSEEMESWLRESTDGEKGKTKLDSAADELWEAKPRSFPARGSSSSSSSAAASAATTTTTKMSAGKTTFSLTRHTRSASTSAAAAPASTATAKKPASRRKTTFV